MSTAANGLIQVALERGIQYIAFNRPEKKNALTHAMYAALTEAMAEAESNPSVRAVCFRGAGDCFTSGNDLKDFLSNPPTDGHSPVLDFINALIDAAKPLIAAVQGPAVGIGTTMLLHCDLAYASSAASFQTPFTRLALCPEAASSFLMPKRIGEAHAARMLLLGDAISAEQARDWGLITELLPQERFDEMLAQRLDALAALPPEAVRAAKALLRNPWRQAVKQAVREEAALFMQRLVSPEAAEAMQAFLERRPPDFSRFA